MVKKPFSSFFHFIVIFISNFFFHFQFFFESAVSILGFSSTQSAFSETQKTLTVIRPVFITHVFTLSAL